MKTLLGAMWLAVAGGGIPAEVSGAAPSGTGPMASSAAALEASQWADWSGRFGGVEWVTKPSMDSALGFPGAIEIREIKTEGGQAVKKGDLLLRGRDEESRVALEIQKVRSADDSDVRNAEAALELAQSRFDAAEKAKQQEALNPAEFDERRIGLKSAKIAVDAARANRQQERLRVSQLTEQAERYLIRAPFDGVVQEVMGEVGQTPDERTPVIRVVKIDPIHVDVPVKTEETVVQGLKAGGKAWVLLNLPGERPSVLEGRILYLAPTADSASGTRRVRVEAANPQGLLAGTRARVRFTDPGEGWWTKPTAAKESRP